MYDDHVGKWCYLLDPRCKGQLGKAVEVRPSGMRMHQIGIVPFDEYRLATDEEIAARWAHKAVAFGERYGIKPGELQIAMTSEGTGRSKLVDADFREIERIVKDEPVYHSRVKNSGVQMAMADDYQSSISAFFLQWAALRKVDEETSVNLFVTLLQNVGFTEIVIDAKTMLASGNLKGQHLTGIKFPTIELG